MSIVDASDLGPALTALAAGRVVGIPTDTVYGLAADPLRPGATAGLFAVKDRPASVHLAVLVAGADQAEHLALPDPVARRLMDRFWPGALTVVVARRPGLGAELGGDDTTIGLRCPDHPVARSLCTAHGPLATTSANRHGEPPATTAAEVSALGGVAVVIDAGPCPAVPSTVVACTGGTPVLLRQGGIPWAEVLAAASTFPRPPSS